MFRGLLIAFMIAVTAPVAFAAEKTAFTDADVLESWNHAQFYVPNAHDNPRTLGHMQNLTAKYPVVLFLHGCNGISPDSKQWGRTFSNNGYVAVVLDSLAIPGRLRNCDVQRKIKSLSDVRLNALRTIRPAEVRLALAKLKTSKWANVSNLFLMGHSEGGSSVALTTAEGFNAVIASGFKCLHDIKVNPIVPLLLLNHTVDPWYIGASCSGFLSKNSGAAEVQIVGKGHQLAHDVVAQNVALSFFAKYRSGL